LANWTSLKIVDCIDKIEKEELILPVVQRDFVWQSEKIELLFDTLLKGDSFGGIMTIKDLKGKKPIFSYRNFIKDYKKGFNQLSKEVEQLKQNISYVVDGQQRLSAFYIGIQGTYNNKQLYFDLLSEIEHKNFNFKFAQNETSKELKGEIDNFDGSSKNKTFWYTINNLYKKIEECGADYHTVFDDIIDENEKYNFDEKELERIKRNIENLTNQIFNFQNIGICEVRLDKKYDEIANRIRVVELFRRLNQGGTKLDGLELMASKLKGYNPEHEKFLQEIEEFNDISFGKDEVIKLIFILQDDHKKTVANITKEDSDFIGSKQDRIKSALKGTKLFLEQSSLYKFYKDEKPSIIPLYFIAYFLFHTNLTNKEIENYFKNSEIDNKNYLLIHRWIFLSILNKIFRSRGAGWTAYSTGIRKILNILSKNKNKDFPIDELFQMYYNHPLDFDENIKKDYLDDYDFDFLMYIIYEKPKTFRINDIDHIHPKSILEKKGIDWNDINSVINYQLLDFSTNRGSKNDKELYDWIKNDVKNQKEYLKMHLIPNDKKLWESNNFNNFLEERGKLIVNKLKSELL
jgi:hypothetical protein